MSSRIIKTYSELVRIPTFEERYEFLRAPSIVGDSTFGFGRYLNQVFYRSREWKRVRQEVIRRDNGCDLAIDGRDIFGPIEIHHITPLTLEDIEEHSVLLLDPDNLVCVSPITHKAIHFGDATLLPKNEPTIRRPNDTCPWLC